MDQDQLYPLKFEPIYQYRIWGGRRLSHLLEKPLPPDDLIGEAWILSDRDDHPSKVTDGKLKGKTISQLIGESATGVMGRFSRKYKRFPLLLKFLDCKQVLSVQVHPNDDQKKYIPKGDTGKTESWVVLETGKDAVIYAGLKPGTDEKKIRAALDKHKVGEDLAHFKPKNGNCVLIKAGTVHTLNDVVVFEVQENSDVTFRLYDWDRVDKKTGKPRDLQVEEALACIDFKKVDVGPVEPVIDHRKKTLAELLVNDEHFIMHRHTAKDLFMIGEDDEPAVLVCIEGAGSVTYGSLSYPLKKGEVMLIPAAAGKCSFMPEDKVVLLEITLPD